MFVLTIVIVVFVVVRVTNTANTAAADDFKSMHRHQLRKRSLGSEPTTIERHPYVVSIEYVVSKAYETYENDSSIVDAKADTDDTDTDNDTGIQNNFCVGSIIARSYVLTTCHCLVDEQLDQVQIRAGTSRYGRGGSVHAIVELSCHEAYEPHPTVSRDIAVVKVDGSFEYDATRMPVELCSRDYCGVTKDVGGVLASWGYMRNEAKPRGLRLVRVPLIGREACKAEYRDVVDAKAIDRVFEDKICAGDKSDLGITACEGDSGGALVVELNGTRRRLLIVGVLSGGALASCNTDLGRNFAAMYTDVAFFADWIAERVAFDDEDDRYLA